MELKDILAKEATIACAKVASKRQLLQLMAEKAAAQTGASAHDIFQTLMDREQLGSTGLGNGLAIPHGRLGDIEGVTAVFARLDQGIDFDAVDDQPVDLVFMLLARAGAGADHLKALSRVARLMRTEGVVEELRKTRDADKVYEILTTSTEASHAA